MNCRCGTEMHEKRSIRAGGRKAVEWQECRACGRQSRKTVRANEERLVTFEGSWQWADAYDPGEART